MPSRSLVSLIGGAAVAVSLLGSSAAYAEEVTLRAVSAFPQGTRFSALFEGLIERVNEKGKGSIQINYVGGGGAVMSPFELGNAIKEGVVDLGNLPGAFYTNLVPEVDAIKMSAYTAQEERDNGAWEYINQLHIDKMNAYHVARHWDCIPFHLYLNKPIEKPDLAGLKIRVTPIYRAFFGSMGADMIRTPPGEVYTALESGVVDGYGWPIQGIHDWGWEKVTKYRVDPGFYRASIEILINFDKWNSLSDDQKAVLNEAGAWVEGHCDEAKEENTREAQRQVDDGIEVITFSEDVSKKYLEQAQETGWAAIIEANPETGPKLKELLTR